MFSRPVASLGTTVAIAALFTSGVAGLHFAAAQTSDCPIPGTRRATADDAAVKNGQIKVGSCYNPNEVGIDQSTEQAKAYLLSIANGLPGTQAPPTKERVNHLNNALAVCAARFLKAYSERYGAVRLTSAFRCGPNTPAHIQCDRTENGRAGGAPNSNHQVGMAIDVGPTDGNYKQMWEYAKQNPQFGVCFPYEGADRPHMTLGGAPGGEGAKCAAVGVKQACSGVKFDPKDVGAQVASSATSPSRSFTDRLRQSLGMPPAPPQIPPYQQPQQAPQQSQPIGQAYQQPISQAYQQPSTVTTGVPTTVGTTPVSISDLLNKNPINLNPATTTGTSTKATSTLDLLNQYAYGTVTEVGTTSQVLVSELLTATADDFITIVDHEGKPVGTTQIPTSSVVTIQPTNSQSTFTSPDLQYSVTAPRQQVTGLQKILADMRAALEWAIGYLRPFAIKEARERVANPYAGDGRQ